MFSSPPDLAAAASISGDKHLVPINCPTNATHSFIATAAPAPCNAEGPPYFVLADDEIFRRIWYETYTEVKVNPKLCAALPPEFWCAYISAGKKR